MNWVEYKLENDSVIKVPYNRCNVASVTKKVLEQLINTVNASIRQAKILEHIKTNYAERMREQYEQGRADAIDEFEPLINLLVSMETDVICNELSTTDYCEQNCKFDCPQKECYLRYLEQLKESK